MLFTHVLSEYLVEQGGLRSRARETINLDRSHLVNAHHDLADHLGVPYEELTIEQVTRKSTVSVLGKYGTTRKPNTVNSRITVLKRFYRWCVNEDYLAVSPVATVQGPRKVHAQPKPWTMEEVEELIECAALSQAPKRNVALLLFLVLTGSRCAEASGADLRNLVRVNGVVTGIRIKSAKNGRMRFLAFPETYLPVFDEYLTWRLTSLKDPTCTRLWVTCRPTSSRVHNNGMTPRSIMQTVQRIIDSSGIQKNGRLVHSFRHTFASAALRGKSHSPRELMEALGHSDLTSLHIYTEAGEADLSAASARHPFVGLLS